MPRHSDGLDGPGLTYGGPTGAPVRERRGLSGGTVVLLVLVVGLAVLLGAAVVRGAGDLAALESGASASSTPSAGASGAASGTPAPDGQGTVGGDASAVGALPAAASETASRFVRAWLNRDPDARTAALAPVTSEGLAAQLADTDPAKIPRAEPTGNPRAQTVSAYSATVAQALDDGSVVVLELAADPQAVHGWLVYSVAPG